MSNFCHDDAEGWISSTLYDGSTERGIGAEEDTEQPCTVRDMASAPGVGVGEEEEG